jgi:hypothetical protein
MTKPTSAPSKPAEPTTHPATTPAPTPTRRADNALHPATPLEALVSRALDQELDWYFAYAESALRRDSVGILPGYAAVRLSKEPTDEICLARGHELARTVAGCLHNIRGRHASVLRAGYTPRRWPRVIEKTFGSLAPIVVRLAFAEDPWPHRSGHTGLEEATALRLSAALHDPTKVKVARLRSEAQRLLGGAIVAYATQRALKAPALGLE